MRLLSPTENAKLYVHKTSSPDFKSYTVHLASAIHVHIVYKLYCYSVRVILGVHLAHANSFRMRQHVLCLQGWFVNIQLLRVLTILLDYNGYGINLR